MGPYDFELASLEAAQNGILERITYLESALLSSSSATQGNPAAQVQQQPLEEKLTALLVTSGINTFHFKRVPPDYYDRSLEERRDLLKAASIHHLCKSIVMVNTQAHDSVKDCSDYKNSKFYLVIIQYTARLNAEKVKQFVYSLNNGKIPKKRFNLRLAPEEEAYRLTGFSHNAVTPVGMKTPLPIIFSDAILNLEPRFFWLGGGEVDLKLGLNTDEFIKIFNPYIADCS